MITNFLTSKRLPTIICSIIWMLMRLKPNSSSSTLMTHARVIAAIPSTLVL